MGKAIRKTQQLPRMSPQYLVC